MTARALWRLAGLLLCVALVAPRGAPLGAQERTLFWPEFSVIAHLDADGRLLVRERQTIRFTGAWNGGERRFNVRRGQELALRRLARVESATGLERELTAGDLSRVDEYQWADGYTLRWRTRLPDDPPFAGSEFTYVIEYTLANLLVPRDDGSFLLDHDFAFADRDGNFARFDLALTLDPAWAPPDDFTGGWTRTDLPPGDGFVVWIPLTHRGAARPASVVYGAEEGTRQSLLVALALAIAALFALLLRRESRLGRFAPLVPRQEMTPSWFDEHVFKHLPEVAGAAWDDHTASPEVAATLARLVQEKKLESSVKSEKIWVFSKDVLHLRLLVPRSQFNKHERALIDALFLPSADRTDTAAVRERYKSTGFDPAALISARLKELVELTTAGPKGAKPSRKFTLLLLVVAVVLFVLGVKERPGDGVVAAVGVAASLPIYIVGSALAYAFQRRVTGMLAGTLWLLVPVAAIGVGLGWFLLYEGRFRVGPLVLAGLTVWAVAIVNSIFNIARSRQSAERIAVRKRLTAAREYFRDELAKQQPQLRDEWFPYLIAFGLGRHVDKWFRAFGGASAAVGAAAIARSGGSSSSSGGNSWTGFGGGGGFSGGGASASFAAAVGGMAASVPSPSSGGSSGGGGGGGSSGGGGGGGW